MLEALIGKLLNKIGALKVEDIEGIIIGYGVLDDYIAIEENTEDGLERGQVKRANFFYLIKTNGNVVGIHPNIIGEGQYPGNGSKARFKAYVGGWLAGKTPVNSKKMMVPQEKGFVHQIVNFYRAVIDPENIKTIN